MSTLSERLGLIINTLADPFRTQDFTDNSETLDDYPGIFICTSLTRPIWGAFQNGMSIFETDTNLIWHWNSAAWERLVPKGWVDGATVTADVSTSSTTYVIAVSVIASIEPGNRKHLIIAQAPGAFNTNGLTQVALFRDANMLQEWYIQGGVGATAEEQPRPIFAVVSDLPTAGSPTYSLQYRAVSGFGGTSTIQGGVNKPIAIDVVEV